MYTHGPASVHACQVEAASPAATFLVEWELMEPPQLLLEREPKMNPAVAACRTGAQTQERDLGSQQVEEEARHI